MKKDYSIDLIRIVAIFLVVLVHISNRFCFYYPDISKTNYLIAVIFNCLSRVCVPLFFMVSGCFLSKEEFNKKKYLNRIIKFIIILIIWNVIYYLIGNNGIGNNFLSSFVTSFFTSLSTQKHLWFMYAIIGIYISLPFIQLICKNMKEDHENLFIILWLLFSGLIVIVVPISRAITKSNMDISYPIPIIQSTYYLGYFIIGSIIYNRVGKEKGHFISKKLYLYILPIICFIIMILVTYFKTIKLGYHYEVMMWYRSIFIALSSICIFILFLLNKDKIKNVKLITRLSELSFGIYLIHMIFVDILFQNYSFENVNSLLIIPLAILVYFISLTCCYIIKKISYLNKIIGIKNSQKV